ncbi:MAG: hypothetical protein J2P19_00215 [Pseudonocardia sp.]|nr:hypothetical protein [Pseudonocardia sp.]
MIWFVVLFAPALLTTVVLLERLEHQLLVDRSNGRDQSDLATMLQIAYPHLVERGGRLTT